ELEQRARERYKSGKTLDLPTRLWQAYGNSTQARDANLVGDLATAVVEQPDSAESHNGLGIAMALNGPAQAFVRHFEQAVQCDPHHVVAGLNFAEALVAGRTARPSGSGSQAGT